MQKHILLLILGLALTACNLTEIPQVPGSVLFQDDFSRPTSGWDRYHDDTYLTDYDQDQYRIEVYQPQTDAWANPHLEFGDVRIEVDAHLDEGPQDNVFGMICRYQDPGNFYFLLISSDGYHGIGLTKNGRRQLLTGDSLLPSDAIQTGGAVNHLRADCVGFQLALYVNGIFVAEARAAEWPIGDIGLIAGTYEQAGTSILFDNFSALQPNVAEAP